MEEQSPVPIDERTTKLDALAQKKLVQFKAIQSGAITNLVDLAKQEAEDELKIADTLLDQQAKLEDMRYDPLLAKDKILSKGEFLRMYPEIVASSNRNDTELGIMIIDADKFKVLNDTEGHPVGDTQLQLLAKMLRAVFHRDTDRIFRVGGEELVAVIEGMTAEQVTHFDTQLRDVYRQLQNDMNHDDPSVNPEDMPIEGSYSQMEPQTFSAGYVIRPKNVNGRPVESSSSMLEQADKALYAAKKGGRNKGITYGSDEYQKIIANNPSNEEHN